MQYSGHLDINPQPGQAVSQIPTGWFKYVNNVLRFLQVRNGRLIVDNDKWTIECGIQKEKRYSFRVYAEIPDGEDNPHLYVDEGYRGVIDSDWEHIEVTDLGEIDSSGVVYARRSYPKVDPFGDICPSGDAKWEEYDEKFFGYGSPPATDALGITIRIASVEYSEDSISIVQEHFGNILVLDIASCQGDCE